VFGAKRQALRAADADLATSAADLQSTQVALIAEVATDYVDLRSYQTRLEIARQNEASQAETLQLTEWRAQAGLVSSIDVEQARSNLEQTRATIPTLETSAAQSKHELSVLLGLSPGTLNPQLATTAPIPSRARHLNRWNSRRNSAAASRRPCGGTEDCRGNGKALAERCGALSNFFP
jgi:outer membrane protein, multidrug efflux system